MPFGISESAIAKAYGPTDLSGVYKSLQAGINKIAKEEQLYRQQNLKDYMQTSKDLEDSSKGVRSKDMPDVLANKQEWKKYIKLRDADPLMFQNNPNQWEKYNSLANKYFSITKQLAKESREFIDEHKNFGAEISGPNSHRYKSDAITMWDKVKDMPLSEIKKQGLDDREKYLSLTPDIEKVYDAFDKSATAKTEKLGKVETKGTGLETRERQIKYKNVPEYGTYVDLAQNTLSKFGKDIRGKQNYAYTILENADDFDNQVKQFKDNMNSASPDLLEAMHLSKDMSKDLYITRRLKDEQNAGKPIQAIANQYLAMKKFNEHFRGVSKDDQGFKLKDDVSKMKLSSSLSEQRADAAFNRRVKQLGLGTPQTFDINPVFNTISSGGETGQKQTKNLITILNTSPLIDPNATMIVTGEGADDPKNDKYSNYTNSKKVLASLNVKKGEDDESIAKKMMTSNEKAGLIAININPNSIRTGKVLAFSWVVTDGQAKNAFLDTQDPQSANQLNKLIRKGTENRKQKVAAAAGLMGDVEGAFNDIK